MILQARVKAKDFKALASVGIIEVKPGSTNTIPGEVKFSLDIRAAKDSTLKSLQKRLEITFEYIASGKSDRSPYAGEVVQVNWRQDSDSPAVHFHQDCIQCVANAVKDIYGDKTQDFQKPMRSGAGHDSVYTSKRVPTCMIFVPSKDGISHNPREYTSPEHCALGAEVLMKAILNYDRLRKDRASAQST